MRYHLIPTMTATQAINLYKYLQLCNTKWPESILTEYWDMGIGMCKTRLEELGHTFKPLREGHPQLTIIAPNGRPVNTLPCH